MAEGVEVLELLQLNKTLRSQALFSEAHRLIAYVRDTDLDKLRQDVRPLVLAEIEDLNLASFDSPCHSPSPSPSPSPARRSPPSTPEMRRVGQERSSRSMTPRRRSPGSSRIASPAAVVSRSRTPSVSARMSHNRTPVRRGLAMTLSGVQDLRELISNSRMMEESCEPAVEIESSRKSKKKLKHQQRSPEKNLNRGISTSSVNLIKRYHLMRKKSSATVTNAS